MSDCWFIFCSATLLITKVLPDICSLMLAGSSTFLMITAVISTPCLKQQVEKRTYRKEEKTSNVQPSGTNRRDPSPLYDKSSRGGKYLGASGCMRGCIFPSQQTRAVYARCTAVCASQGRTALVYIQPNVQEQRDRSPRSPLRDVQYCVDPSGQNVLPHNYGTLAKTLNLSPEGLVVWEN